MGIKQTVKTQVDYLARANQLSKEGNLTEAIINYRCAIDKKPTISAYQGLANAFKKQGNIEDAISCYQEALSINPNLPQIHTAIGYLLNINNELDKALIYYLKAVESKPDYWRAHSRLRRLILNQNQTQKVVTSLDRVIKNNPDSIFPSLTLGYILARQGKSSEAINYIKKATDSNVSKLKPNFSKYNGNEIGTRKPDFMIIGSAKSGTTSLYNYLVQHPQVLPAVSKEIGYFDTTRYKNELDWYLSHFPEVTKGDHLFLTGEATPTYLNRHNIAERVHTFFPEVKLIVIMRNPVERTVSAYHHSVKDNGEKRSLEEVINAEIQLIQGMSDPSEIMIPANRVKAKYRFEPRYVVFSLYYYFLKKWFNVFPREQFLILNSSDFYTKTPEVMNQVFSFLDLPNYELSEYRQYTKGSYSSIDKDLRKNLSDFFQPHNQKLEDYLGIKLNWY